MSANKDYRSDLDMWADMWDEMQKSDIHPKIERPQPAPYSAGSTARDDYYDYFDSGEEIYQPDGDGEALLQEDRVPNPVYPDSVGTDQNQPNPVWVDERLLKEIQSLKNRLFKLENKMARLGQGKKLAEKQTHSMFDKSMFSEIKALRERIDRVSNRLGIDEEPSPYETDRVAPRKNRNIDRGRYVRKPQSDSHWSDE